MTTAPVQNHSHPDELLPWYVNNTLALHQRNEVEGHLEQCPRCQNEVVFLKHLRQETKTIPTISPGELGLQRLLRQVKQENKSKQIKLGWKVSWWRPALAIAASLIIVVQAGLLINTLLHSVPIVPLASPPKEGVILQISFSPSATESQIRESLMAVQGTFESGPGALGVYRIRLDIPPKNQAKIEEAIQELRQRIKVVIHVAKE